MKQIILTLAAVAVSVTAVSGQGTGMPMYYIDGLIYRRTSGTTVSCEGAFDDGVKNIVIPETINANGSVFTVTGISDSAFADYSYLYSVTIPGSVTTIGNSAFRGCSRLASVTIPNSVTTIGGLAFYGCSGLASVTIGNGVTFIGNSAFYGCDNLASVTIPNSVTTIGHFAFSDCSGLASVTIGNSVTSIGSFAFYGCSGLESVNISDLSAWCRIDFTDSESNPLYHANNLYLDGELIRDLTIPDDITEIKYYAFCGCSRLASVTIPDSVISIWDSAFEDCSGLASVTIPNSVTTIGDSAFEDCSGLASVTIPNSVTTIGDSAFENCWRIETLVIGRNVTSIGNCAFYVEYYNLKRIDVLASVPPSVASDDVFYSYRYSDTELNVPVGSLEAYRSADVWKKFKNIQEKDFGGVDGVEDDAVSVTAKGGSIEIAGADNAPVEIYNLSGQLVHSGTETTVGGLARGIYIVRVAGQTFKIAL